MGAINLLNPKNIRGTINEFVVAIIKILAQDSLITRLKGFLR